MATEPQKPKEIIKANSTTTIGQYLLQRLSDHGVEHIFGLPGDYILRFDKMIEEHPIELINTTRENTAGYLADAYARIRGLGVACITYGVGINITNAIAQANVESSPVIVISGTPGADEFEKCQHLHHILAHSKHSKKDSTQLEIFKKITIDQAVLDRPEKAAAEIDRVIETCLYYKKPVYIELPRDLVDAPIGEYTYKPTPFPATDEDTLKEAIEEVELILKKVKKPMIWLGHEIHRYGLTEEVLKFAEKYHIPIASTLLGKSAISEDHPLYIGLYQGEMSHEDIRDFVESSDCAILLGVILNDVNTGIQSAKMDQENKIIANADSITIRHHAYPEITLNSFVKGLAKTEMNIRFRLDFPACIDQDIPRFTAEKNKKISTARTFSCIQHNLKPNHIIVSDIGDCLFGSSELITKQGGYVSNAYFATLGFGTPGAIGTAIAMPKKRVIGIVGDGAFQMTGTELSTAIRYNLDPIIIILNNQGFATERPLIEGEYNNIVNWNYSELPNMLGGGVGIKVTTEEEMQEALEQALKERGKLFVIEVVLDKNDYSPALKRFCHLISRKGT